MTVKQVRSEVQSPIPQSPSLDRKHSSAPLSSKPSRNGKPSSISPEKPQPRMIPNSFPAMPPVAEELVWQKTGCVHNLIVSLVETFAISENATKALVQEAIGLSRIGEKTFSFFSKDTGQPTYDLTYHAIKLKNDLQKTTRWYEHLPLIGGSLKTRRINQELRLLENYVIEIANEALISTEGAEAPRQVSSTSTPPTPAQPATTPRSKTSFVRCDQQVGLIPSGPPAPPQPTSDPRAEIPPVRCDPLPERSVRKGNYTAAVSIIHRIADSFYKKDYGLTPEQFRQAMYRVALEVITTKNGGRFKGHEAQNAIDELVEVIKNSQSLALETGIIDNLVAQKNLVKLLLNELVAVIKRPDNQTKIITPCTQRMVPGTLSSDAIQFNSAQSYMHCGKNANLGSITLKNKDGSSLIIMRSAKSVTRGQQKELVQEAKKAALSATKGIRHVTRIHHRNGTTRIIKSHYGSGFAVTDEKQASIRFAVCIVSSLDVALPKSIFSTITDVNKHEGGDKGKKPQDERSKAVELIGVAQDTPSKNDDHHGTAFRVDAPGVILLPVSSSAASGAQGSYQLSERTISQYSIEFLAKYGCHADQDAKPEVLADSLITLVKTKKLSSRASSAAQLLHIYLTHGTKLDGTKLPDADIVKLSSLLVCLSQELNIVMCNQCKSGEDRTLYHVAAQVAQHQFMQAKGHSFDPWKEDPLELALFQLYFTVAANEFGKDVCRNVRGTGKKGKIKWNESHLGFSAPHPGPALYYLEGSKAEDNPLRVKGVNVTLGGSAAAIGKALLERWNAHFPLMVPPADSEWRKRNWDLAKLPHVEDIHRLECIANLVNDRDLPVVKALYELMSGFQFPENGIREPRRDVQTILRENAFLLNADDLAPLRQALGIQAEPEPSSPKQQLDMLV
jgi:hypothetical protein